MSLEPKILKDRAKMFAKVRSFFSKKNILEVDPPSLNKNPSIDEHIDVMKTFVLEKEIGYLHASPEYAMKRLLATFNQDIYFLGHVFRKNELGDFHNPEFCMIEWYRKNISFDLFIKETIDLLFLFLKKISFEALSYKNAFLKFLNINPLTISLQECLELAKEKNISVSGNLTKDAFLNLFMSYLIEPRLKNKLFMIYDFPSSQAALAKTTIKNDEEVAERFEFYYQGIEIANGFHELTDEKIQRERLNLANKKRKEKLPLDEKFLSSLEKLGDCFGIAVGFDRLMMLRHNKKIIKDVLPFSWEET
jgi:elongation factor P--(R)-beta-lysine ligase